MVLLRAMLHSIVLCSWEAAALMQPRCPADAREWPLTWFANMDSSVQVQVTEDVCCPANRTAMSMPVISSSVVYLPL